MRTTVPTMDRGIAVHSTFGILTLCLLVAVVRVLADWLAGGIYPVHMLATLLVSTGRYWLAFFLLAWVLQLVLNEPWQENSKVLKGWILMGVVPPLVNALSGGEVVRYDYVWQLWPSGDGSTHDARQMVSSGEVAKWSIIALWASLLVWTRTRRPLRASVTLFLVYGASLLILAVPSSLAEGLRAAYGWPADHRLVLLMIFQTIAVLFVYLGMQPRILKSLLWRSPHALPFTLFCFLGSAFYGEISITTVIYAVILFLLAGWVAIGQNDYFDMVEDQVQGRAPYLNLEDVRFLTTTACMVIAVVASAHSTTAFIAFMTLSTAVLYNYPFYRGKRYFPTNLKIEGLWGFAAFAWGILAAYEHAAYGLPRWWLDHSPLPMDPALRGPFDGVTIIAMFLALGGFSLVAVLKDYKDWESDRVAGVQTVYTLAAKRGWSFRNVHNTVLVLAGSSLAIAPLLLAWSGKIPFKYSTGGVLAAVVVGGLMSGAPSTRKFRKTLIALSLFFLYLVLALHFH